MPEDAPARRRRAAAVGTGRRRPANADPHRPPANARDRRRRERMGVGVGRAEAQEEADLFDRYEEEGDAGDQPHVFPARAERDDPDIVGSSSMMPPMHASQPAGPQRFSGCSMRSMSFLIRVETGLPGVFLRMAGLGRTDGPYHSGHSRSSRIGGKSIAYTCFTAAMRYTGSQYGPHSIPTDAHAATTCRHGR
ncbi:hypothetical protein PIB30_103854 [Stylosanthes scabra]|uniref:Uncharacterized protein n=1 Tax=Stylosanthes scabra TaxID=79078 RepID=A0ABU6RYM4_9FABA|nr:hypothetical protein [Stylosanthes scabra]